MSSGEGEEPLQHSVAWPHPASRRRTVVASPQAAPRRHSSRSPPADPTFRFVTSPHLVTIFLATRLVAIATRLATRFVAIVRSETLAVPARATHNERALHSIRKSAQPCRLRCAHASSTDACRAPYTHTNTHTTHTSSTSTVRSLLCAHASLIAKRRAHSALHSSRGYRERLIVAIDAVGRWRRRCRRRKA